MIILSEPASIKVIREKYADFFETMVKIVVDIEKNLVALNAEMHADLEQFLLEKGSLQKNLWGANIYFERPDSLEFTSLINIRPSHGNKSMEVTDSEIRRKMEIIVRSFIIY